MKILADTPQNTTFGSTSSQPTQKKNQNLHLTENTHTHTDAEPQKGGFEKTDFQLPPKIKKINFLK